MKRIKPLSSYLRMKAKWAEGVAGFAIGGSGGGGVDRHALIEVVAGQGSQDEGK